MKNTNLKKKKRRRSDKKIMTKEARVLKHFRQSRKLSMTKAAELIGVSEATVNHSENGRRDLDLSTIQKFLKAYSYSYEEYSAVLNGEVELMSNVRDDCIELIKRLDDTKLKAIKSILESF